MKKINKYINTLKYWYEDTTDLISAWIEYYRNRDSNDENDYWKEAIISKIKYICGRRLTPSKIPHNTPYCYNSTGCCPYFIKLNQEYTCCKFNGFVGFSPSHFDQCKICNVGWPKEITDYES